MNPAPDQESDHPRVVPSASDDPAALREHGRQLAMDALLTTLLRPQAGASVARPRRAAGRRGSGPWILAIGFGAGAAAVAAAVLVALVWLRPPVEPPPDDGPVAVTPVGDPAPGWSVRPAGDAEFRFTAPGRIRLERGELRITSVPIADPGTSRAELTVETPSASATARGTDFLIGTHIAERKTPVTTRLTRVLVLAGAVSLFNALGRIDGGPGELLAAENDQTPVAVVVKANSEFAADLYRRVAKENPGANVFVSPYSISTALAMTAEGARGATAEEFGRALRLPAAARRVGGDAQQLPWNTALLHTGMAGLHERLASADREVPQAVRDRIEALRRDHAAADRKAKELVRGRDFRGYLAAVEAANKLAAELNAVLATTNPPEVRIANRIWVERTLPIRQEFLDAVATHYKTGAAAAADFRNEPEAWRRKINEWGEAQTKGRIKEVLPPQSVTSSTTFAIANAVYFLGKWAEPFDPAATRPAAFAAPGGPVTVPMMSATLRHGRYAAFNADGSRFDIPSGPGAANYPGAGGFRMAELPYAAGELSMVIVVPQSADGLARIEEMVTAERLAEWTAALQVRPVVVGLPRFRFETAYKLTDTLAEMGMPSIRTGADLTGLSPEARDARLNVFHKAFVAVDEKGTEAAAMTVMVVKSGAGPFVPEVRADRPFLFLIRDVKTGTILFMGRVANPA